MEPGGPRVQPRLHQAAPDIRYDFASASVDAESFDFALWRRYIKSALRADRRLLTYGEPQGEPDLRAALCSYVAKSRNVVCTPEQIVVGAGVQSLLHILCGLLDERPPVGFWNNAFAQGAPFLKTTAFQCIIMCKEGMNLRHWNGIISACYIVPLPIWTRWATSCRWRKG